MRPLFLLGRAMFGGFFLYKGINHFLNEKMMSQYAATKGTAAPDAAVTVSGAADTVRVPLTSVMA